MIHIALNNRLRRCCTVHLHEPARTGGKAYPQNQTAIDLTLTGFTSAYASYAGVFLPALRINSYQLFHNGVPANYIRVGEDFTSLRSC